MLGLCVKHISVGEKVAGISGDGGERCFQLVGDIGRKFPAQLFAAHNAFFRARSHRTIVLANGQTPAGVHCIDVQTDEERFVRSLMRLQHSVRRPEHALPVQPQAAQPLTEREAEVLTLIAGGLINKQVADRLGIGLTTVISHRRNIMEKLGIRTAAGLVVYALAAGYVDPDGM